MLLVASVGQMLVLVVGGFDISVGATAGFASTALALLVDDFGLYGAITAALALGAVVGSVNGLVIAYLGVNPFVATLAMLTFLTGLSNELSSGASVPITDRGMSAFGADEWGPLPGTMGVGLVVVFIAYLLLNRVRAGLYIYAIGGLVRRRVCRGFRSPVTRFLPMRCVAFLRPSPGHARIQGHAWTGKPRGWFGA